MKTTQVLFWRHPVHWGFDEHDQCQDLSQNSSPVCQILLYLAPLILNLNIFCYGEPIDQSLNQKLRTEFGRQGHTFCKTESSGTT